MAGGFPFRPVQGLELDQGVILREGFQCTNVNAAAGNISSAVTVGQVLGQISTLVGTNLWIESITIQCSIDIMIVIQRGDTNLITNGSQMPSNPVMVGPTYGGVILPVNALMREGEQLTFISRTAVPSGGGTETLNFRVGVNGRRLTNDLAFEAPKKMLVIGDSITNSTGPTVGSEFYHARIALALKSQGKHYRRIVKGSGGWTTGDAVYAANRGWFDINDPDLILIMLGTNETSLVTYQTNFTQLLTYLTQYNPTSKICVVAPPPRQSSAETTILVPQRSWTESYVASLVNPNIHFTSLAASFDRTVDSNYVASDGASGTRLHPTGATHGVMANFLLNEWTTSGFLQKL